MYVCICHGVSDHEIRRAAQDGVRDMHVLTMRTGCGSGCGSCVDLAVQIMEEAVATQDFPLPILQAA